MITKQEFGRTGHASSRVIFGAYALSKATQTEADRILDLLLECGVNHIDTALSYGSAEQRVGPWLERYRSSFFVATKTRRRDYHGAWRDLQRSLERLRIDCVDLWQMHGLTGAVGWERAMGPGGALDAFVEARDKGLVRFLGVTGHGLHAPQMHLRSLERFDFDTVLTPLNYSLTRNPHYAADFEALAALCSDRRLALQTIKSIARRPWKGRSKTYNTYFYEPLEAQPAIDRAVYWVLGHPQTFLITAGDMRLVPKILEAACRFQARPPDAEMDTEITELDIQPIFN